MALNKQLSVIPNVLLYFSQYIQDNVDEAVAGAKGMLAIKIYGPDVVVLQRLGDQIADIANGISGMVDVANNQQLGQPQYQVAINREEASRYFPREQLGLSTQCGFGTVWEGNPIPEAVQEAKLRLVADIARRVWQG